MHYETVQRQILFILGGLYEVVDLNPHLTSLINATNFCHSSVILTSRPQPATSPVNNVTHKLQIMGFSVKDQQEFIKRYQQVIGEEYGTWIEVVKDKMMQECTTSPFMLAMTCVTLQDMDNQCIYTKKLSSMEYNKVLYK